MKIEKHGLPMHGLRKVAGETKGLLGYYDPHYFRLHYDMTTGEIWTSEFYDYSHSWHTSYHGSDVISCGNLCAPHTMQEIADIVAESVNRKSECDGW